MQVDIYCEKVEKKDKFNKRAVLDVKIKDDFSPLISLRKVGLDLLFEPSIMPNHQYFVREPLVAKLERISNELAKDEKTLIIRSAWRSFHHQRKIRQNKTAILRNLYPFKNDREIDKMVSEFIAPETKSMHATGGAVDALIFDKRNICVMDFGTNKGLDIELNKECYPHHPMVSAGARKNRELLIGLFHSEGFVVDVKEYWHFDYGNPVWAVENKKDVAFYGVTEPKQD